MLFPVLLGGQGGVVGNNCIYDWSGSILLSLMSICVHEVHICIHTSSSSLSHAFFLSAVMDFFLL